MAHEVIVALRASTPPHACASASLMKQLTIATELTAVFVAKASTTARRSSPVARAQSAALWPVTS